MDARILYEEVKVNMLQRIIWLFRFTKVRQICLQIFMYVERCKA